MDGEAGWWTTSGNIGLPPLARVMGVGRQQHLRNIRTTLSPLDLWTNHAGGTALLTRWTGKLASGPQAGTLPFVTIYLETIDVYIWRISVCMCVVVTVLGCVGMCVV